MKATKKKTIFCGIFILIFFLLSFLGCGEKSHESWYNKGVNLLNFGRYKEALEAFNKAIEIKPDYQEAWFYKGAALIKLGCLNEALEAYNKAIEIKPDFQFAWFIKGVTLTKVGCPNEALEAFNKAIEIRPALASMKLPQTNGCRQCQMHLL